MKSIAIIGAGISGLSLGRMLSKKCKVQIFEKAALPGGLVKCERVQDNLFHRVGGHVFNSKNKAVLDWFWHFFDRDNEFLSARRNAKIYMNGHFIGYPIENYLYQLPKELVNAVLDDLLSADYKPKSPFEYTDFESFLRGNFGETLYQLYFKPYNYKIWNTDLSSVPLEWLEGKLPMPNLKEILLSNIVKQEEKSMVHSTFYYAKEGGSQFIVNRLAETLTIHCNSEVSTIKCTPNGKPMLGDEYFDAVVFTGDIRTLPFLMPDLASENPSLFEKVQAFRSNGTSNLFCECDHTDISWLYLPEPNTKAHRIIYTGGFSPTNSRGSKRHTCVVEFSGYVGYQEMVEQLKNLPGNMTPLAHNHEPNSYVIQDANTRQTVAEMKKLLGMNKVFLLGRFADWEYYNMDKAIEAAFLIEAELQTLIND
jgi:protoporphyrinogen oxidase